MTITKKQSFVDEHDDEHDNEYDNNDVDDRSLESSFESVDSSSSVSSSFSDNTSITPASSSTTISSFNYSSSAKGTGRRIKRKTDEGLVGGLLSFKEERAVVSARWSFLFLLLAAAAVVGTVVYVVMKKEEEEDFESQFTNLGSEVLDVSNDKVKNALGVLKGVATTITSFMHHENDMLMGLHGYHDHNNHNNNDDDENNQLLDEDHSMMTGHHKQRKQRKTMMEMASMESTRNNQTTTTNPPGFMTLPDMEEHFSTARDITGALVMAYMPLIRSEHLQDWNQYSQANQGWISQSNGGTETEPILAQIWDYSSFDDENNNNNRRRRRSLSSCDGRRRRGRRVLGDDTGHGHEGHGEQDDVFEHQDEHQDEHDHRVPLQAQDGPFAPIWGVSPPPLPNNTQIINYNLLAKPIFQQAVDFVEYTRKPTFLDVCDQAQWFDNSNYSNELQTVIVHPVFADFSDQSEIVGYLAAILPWRVFFEDILAMETEPISIVMENTCEEVFTLEIQGQNVTVVDESDQHDAKYDNMGFTETFAEFANPPQQIIEDVAGLGEICIYSISAYPTSKMEEAYRTKKPIWYAVVVLCVFLSTSLYFLFFDSLVKKRQNKVMATAIKQNAIVSSLFPKNIQAKMMAEVEANHTLSTVGKAGLRNFLRDDDDDKERERLEDKSKPIADLFPDTTIMFADIAGFTAWSSTREPSAVFRLLETIYHEFDSIAKKRRVFKVEVVGDCYVAVCGLPDARKNHAVVMAKFANECLRKMHARTRDLEVELGPDTGELGLRVGLHSGPVVAGVLRGEKSRFQLFGDTMNTASRMESTGISNRIQISQETADLLIAARKQHWCIPRADKVSAKGKGMLSTFWLQTGDGADATSHLTSETSVSSGFSLDDFGSRGRSESKKIDRIADWTVEVLACILKEIEIRRLAMNQKRDLLSRVEKSYRNVKKSDKTVLDEVETIIELPDFNARASILGQGLSAENVSLDHEVLDELRDYVRTIASMYNDNPFHNFFHANHVTMSVTKLLSRIVAPDIEDAGQKSLHDHTYGITSDPLTRFAVVLAALIHDVDHQGVSNMQLVKEKLPVAKLYKNKSVAEQNSVDLAWDLLMEPKYQNLRRQIYSTEAEFKRFRQLVVNTVMATDIMDKDLKKLRNDRWDAAFALTVEEERENRTAVNRKATIVIEHLIQASDVAHTMQHWHIYRKWNERLFAEMYRAYQEGRMEKDPSVDWYKGEIGFFDFYIIPLAKKLKECGVFGVSSDEYLSYAQQNRKEWEKRGEEVVSQMLSKVCKENNASGIQQQFGGPRLESMDIHFDCKRTEEIVDYEAPLK